MLFHFSLCLSHSLFFFILLQRKKTHIHNIRNAFKIQFITINLLIPILWIISYHAEKDINDDVFGAMNVGMKGILVKTGKYIANIEAKYSNQPTKIVDTFANAVDWLIAEQFTI